MARQPEGKLQAKIRVALQEKGAYVNKNHGGQFSSGRPDIEGCFRGYHFGLEVKMPGRENTVTKHQQYHLDCIKEAGGISAVVTDPGEALVLVMKEVRKRRELAKKKAARRAS
jgi:penicillin-binding protein-related factor A (putative recombinase)